MLTDFTQVDRASLRKVEPAHPPFPFCIQPTSSRIAQRVRAYPLRCRYGCLQGCAAGKFRTPCPMMLKSIDQNLVSMVHTVTTLCRESACVVRRPNESGL